MRPERPAGAIDPTSEPEDRLGSARLERRVANGIAVLVPAFGLIGALALFTEQGPRGTAARTVCLLIVLSTIPVGAWWWKRAVHATHMPSWFVVYADLGVAGMLLTMNGRDLALYSTVLFAVIGTYIAYFSRRRTLKIHTVFVNIVILALAGLSFHENSDDPAASAARVLIALCVVNSVLAFRAVIKRQLDLANTDSLTGLLNRRGLELRLDRLMDTLGPERSVALMVVDLDRFKAVNDTHGHAIGDRVLRITARRLLEASRPRSCVARTGGEEFMVAMPLSNHGAELVAQGVRDAVHDPHDQVPVTVSVGVAVLPRRTWAAASGPNRTAGLIHEALLDADTAMYEAKRAGGNRVTMFVDR